jgi:geranylgeranylglycerol-phosphate geranylgeranyltransferase
VSKLKSILTALHLFNSLGAGVGTLIGYLITAWYYHLPVDLLALWMTGAATALITAGGFVVNDIIDIDIDRVNRPDRPLAAGEISVATAWALYWLMNTTALGLALKVDPVLGFVSLGIVLLLFMYSTQLKQRFLVGHLAIAAMGAMVLPFGGLALGHMLPVLLSILFVFPAFFAREVLKTVPDYEGDKAHGVDNLATRYGPRAALRISKVALLLTASTLPLILPVWPLNRWYMIAAVAGIWPILLYALLRSTPQNSKMLIAVSKLLFLMTAGALLVGSAPGLM